MSKYIQLQTDLLILYLGRHPEIKYIVLVALTLILSVLSAIFITKGLLLRNVVLNKLKETKKYLLLNGNQKEINFNIPDDQQANDDQTLKVNFFGKPGEETSFENPDTQSQLISSEDKELILNEMSFEGQQYVERLERELLTLRGAFNANANSMNIVRNYYESNQLAFPGTDELAERERLLKLIKRLSESNAIFKEMLANQGGEEHDLSGQLGSLFDSKNEVKKLNDKIKDLENQISKAQFQGGSLLGKQDNSTIQKDEDAEVNFLKMIRELSNDNIELSALLKAAEMNQDKVKEEMEKFIQAQRENRTMKEQIGNLERQLKKLTDGSETMTDETQKLMEEKALERERGDKFLKSFQDIASKNEEMQRLLMSADMDAETLKKEIEAFLSAMRENVVLKTENQDLHHEISLLKGESKSMLDETQSMSGVLQQNNDYRTKIEKMDKTIEELQRQKNNFENEAQGYQSEMDHASKSEQENKELKIKLNESDIQVSKLENVIRENDHNYAKMADEVNALMDIDTRNKKLGEDNDAHKHQIQKLENKIEYLEKEQTSLLSEVENGVKDSRESANLTKENSILQKENRELNKTMNELLKETENFSTELSASKDKYMTQKDKTRKYSEKCEQIENTLEKERIETKKQIKNINETAENEMNTMLQELDKFAQVERQNKELEKELAELKKHNSKAA